jgi:hypothetical protein
VVARFTVDFMALLDGKTPVADQVVLGVVAAHLTESDAVVNSFFTGAFSYLLVWLLVGVTMGSS